MQQLGEALMRTFSLLDERQFMVNGEWVMLRMNSQGEWDSIKLKTMMKDLRRTRRVWQVRCAYHHES